MIGCWHGCHTPEAALVAGMPRAFDMAERLSPDEPQASSLSLRSDSPTTRASKCVREKKKERGRKEGGEAGTLREQAEAEARKHESRSARGKLEI